MTCMPDYEQHYDTPVVGEELHKDFDILIFGCSCGDEHHSWQVDVPHRSRHLTTLR
jgi:hypothetical protein